MQLMNALPQSLAGATWVLKFVCHPLSSWFSTYQANRRKHQSKKTQSCMASASTPAAKPKPCQNLWNLNSRTGNHEAVFFVQVAGGLVAGGLFAGCRAGGVSAQKLGQTQLDGLVLAAGHHIHLISNKSLQTAPRCAKHWNNWATIWEGKHAHKTASKGKRRLWTIKIMRLNMAEY